MNNMKLGIALTDKNDWTALALANAAAQKNCEFHLIDMRDMHVTFENDIKFYCKNIDFSDLDALIIRDMGAGSMDGVSFRFDVLRQLEMQGTLMINNPEAIRNAANKYYTTYILKKAGLPIPETYAVQQIDQANKIVENLHDAIIKPVFGYKGKGIIRIKNNKLIEPNGTVSDSDWKNKINMMLETSGMLYVQKFISNPGRDIRVYLLNGKILGAIYRNAQKGYWINNLSQGGISSPCDLTYKQREICIKAADAVGTTFAGVDLIESSDGCMILEVNGTPSGAGIFKSCGVNVAEHIIDYIFNEL